MPTEKTDVLFSTVQRFAVSALSKERYSESVNEEMMIDKSTGEVLIKDKLGFIVSADSTNRTALAMAKAISDAEQSGICGQFYQVTFNDFFLPTMINYNENILSKPLELSYQINKLLFNFDISEHFCDTDSFDTLTEEECGVQIDIRRGLETFTVLKKISDINKFIINSLDYIINDDDPIEITGITFIPSPYAVSDIRYRISLHNVFLTCNV